LIFEMGCWGSGGMVIRGLSILLLPAPQYPSAPTTPKRMILVIFDVDGTLVYSERRDSRCFAETYEEIYGKPFPSIDWTTFPHVTDTVIFETVLQSHFKRKPTLEEVLVFEQRYLEKLMDNRKKTPHLFREVAGARKMIERISQQEGFAVAIATGGWKKSAELKLKHIGIPAEQIPLSGADGKYNREDIIHEAIRLTRIPQSTIRRTVYIGDAIWDVTTTRNLKMNFVGIRREHDHEVLQKAGARHVLSDFTDFEGFVELLHRAEPPG